MTSYKVVRNAEGNPVLILKSMEGLGLDAGAFLLQKVEEINAMTPADQEQLPDGLQPFAGCTVTEEELSEQEVQEISDQLLALQITISES